jgi:hypothetical protein
MYELIACQLLLLGWASPQKAAEIEAAEFRPARKWPKMWSSAGYQSTLTEGLEIAHTILSPKATIRRRGANHKEVGQ